MCKIAVTNYNGHFSKPMRQARKNAGMYSQNLVSKVKAKTVNAVFCDENH